MAKNGTSEPIAGVSKGCCLEVFQYSRASKKHGTFVTPGSLFLLKKVFSEFPIDFSFSEINSWGG